jgi:hypothetical protein
MTENERRRILAEARRHLAKRQEPYSPPARRFVADWPLSSEPEPFVPEWAPEPKLDTRPPPPRAQAAQVDWPAVIDQRIDAAVATAFTTMRGDLISACEVIADEVNASRRDAVAEMTDQVRALKIELCELQTTLCELRTAVANDRAKSVLDLPALPSTRRTDLN